MLENQLSQETSDKLQRLYERREELLVIRDILALELEIKELRRLKTNGNTDSKESEGRESV